MLLLTHIKANENLNNNMIFAPLNQKEKEPLIMYSWCVDVSLVLVVSSASFITLCEESGLVVVIVVLKCRVTNSSWFAQDFPRFSTKSLCPKKSLSLGKLGWLVIYCSDIIFLRYYYYVPFPFQIVTPFPSNLDWEAFIAQGRVVSEEK